MSTARSTPDWVKELQSSLPLLLTKDEAAEALRLSKTTLERAVAAHKLKVIKHGTSRSSRVMVPRAEVLRYLMEHYA